MRFFTADGETDTLDATQRNGQRGAFAALTEGVTHYELGGPSDGPLAVFVPGLTTPLAFWDDVVRILHRQGVRTLTYSAYGRGYSDRLAGDYGPLRFVQQLDDLLSVADAREIHLIGSSMGALIALRYARTPRVPVASLILSGPAGVSGRRNPASRLPGVIGPLVGRRLLRRSLLAHLDHNVRSPEDVDRLRHLVLHGFRFKGSMYALLSTLMTFPFVDQDALFDTATADLPDTMLLWGADDQVTPAEGFDIARTLLQPARAEQIDRAGHMLSFEQPAAFAERASAFIQDQSHG